MDKICLVELQTEWADSFFAIGERENLSLEDTVGVVGFTVLSLLRWLYTEAAHAKKPFPASYLFQCMAIIEHGLAHVPEGVEPEYDEWLKMYCSPGPFQIEHSGESHLTK